MTQVTNCGKLVTVSGKGGVGKTTITALLAQALLDAGAATPLLLADGDPAATLHLALGLPLPTCTLADVREEMQALLETDYRATHSTKENPVALLEARGVIQQVTPDWHLLAMGQSEGAGCYCGVNAALSFALRALLPRYPWVIVDNEAGVEHLARKNIAHVDFFIVVTLPQQPAQAVARRIIHTAQGAGMTWTTAGVIVNRCPAGEARVDIAGWPVWAALPEEPALPQLEQRGNPAVQLSATAPFRRHLRELAERLLQGGI